MTILANILLGLAAFLYLVPLQIFLRQPIVHSGHAAGGVIAFVFVTIPLWVTIFLAWCVPLSRGQFDWLGGGRGWQSLVLFVTFLALTFVTSLAAMLREDPQIPWALRPVMTWGIYVLPPLAILASFALLNPSLEVPTSVARWTLSFCGVVALIPSLGMGVQWLVWQEKRAVEAAEARVAFEDQNVRSLVAEVEALDPIKDLGRLLGHAASNRFDAPRSLATTKIQTNPTLQEELALKLTNEWSLEALGYLELNDAPDNAALALPVRTALESLAPWIAREVSNSNHFWPETYASETQMALAVADKFSPYGIDYVAAVKAWRAAFNHPNTKEARLMAPRLIDEWLASRAATEKSPARATSRR
ncbi:hypothetical protein CMV30_11135 [Nibricoccus aquaticus]|uniref:Uncharacterized protein n=1 Tax=Nibricoccus aquaticus TaxID=2576891 RepID=A0A290Q7R3_9BACT|nr:hypothetical protein [Nibricoccus aquaticus]ATC64463.1 hypothetical protein CMV30_11135 [Nibricoccus aquaticus]